MQECFLFSTHSPAFIVCRLCDDGHSDWYEVIYHCSFDLHFSDSDVEHLFMCLCACLLWRNICLGLFPTFWLGCLFFCYWVVWAACIFWKLILFSCFVCKYFLPFWGSPQILHIAYKAQNNFYIPIWTSPSLTLCFPISASFQIFKCSKFLLASELLYMLHMFYI